MKKNLKIIQFQLFYKKPKKNIKTLIDMIKVDNCIDHFIIYKESSGRLLVVRDFFILKLSDF